MNNVFDTGQSVQVFYDSETGEVLIRSDDNPDITLNPNEVIDLYNKLNELKNRK